MDKKILYVGNVGQVGTALTIHAQNMARLFNRVGYKVEFVCNGGSNNIADFSEFNYSFTKNYIKLPKLKGVEWLIEERFGIKLFNIAKRKIMICKPDIVVLYGYSIEKELIKLCKKLNIKLILERVDWFEKEDRVGFFSRNILQKNIDKSNTLTDKKANGVIAISKYLFDHYNQIGQDVIYIPPIFKFNETRKIERKQDDNFLHLVYAGSLGGNKDQIFPVLKAMQNINADEIKIKIDLIGISNSELERETKIYNWGEVGVKTFGRISNNESKMIVENADFSILLRKNRRYAKAGFSTKFAESMSLAVPVICTKVGGADTIITNLKDGVHLLNNDTETVQNTLMYLLSLNRNEILEMKRQAFKTACRKFLIDRYEQEIIDFINIISRSENE